MEKTHLQRVREKVAEIKKHKFFDPTYDPVFKKIFKNKKNLIHFLNAVLHLEGDSRIKSVKHLMPTVKLRNQVGKEKQGCFDIHAKTMCGKYIDVEMQRASQEDFLDRIELYSTLLSANAKIAMDAEIPAKQREQHPYLMPTVYSIWICNFKVPFCKHFREELALYRTADVGKPHPLTIYPKKKYIIIDLTRFVPQEDNTQENQWIELFWNMPTANAMPRGIDKVVRAVYRQLLVNKATASFITEVATDMIDRDEYNACISYARNKGLAEGEKRGKAKAKKKFATEKKKIAQFLQSKGVSVKLLNAAMAIK
jgi:predicted transposase/invertase (TIGR01784 family)